MVKKRIGILGGTFDPVHNGHIRVAYETIQSLSLDFVVFVPSYIPPHKQDKKCRVQPLQRLALLEKALYGERKFIVSTHEMESRKVVYTADSIRTIKDKYGTQHSYFLLLGSDWAGKMHTWKKLEYIMKETNIVFFPRDGKQFNPEKGCSKIDIPVMEISSTMIRNYVSMGRSIKGLVPAPLEKSIINLYI